MTRTWSLSRLRFNATLVALTLVLAFSTSPSSTASRNGVEVPENRFTVGFTYMDDTIPSVCSGILIAPKIIATARHCVKNDAGVLGVDYEFVNPGQRLDGTPSRSRVVKTVISDEDLAFVFLDRELTGATFIRIADVNSISTLVENSPLFGFGYGAVFETSASYSSLVRRYELAWKVAGKVADLKNTYELTSNVATACRGDSGGPITALLPNGQTVVIGVISGAANVEGACGTPGPDGLYRMRVTLINPYLALVPEYIFPKVKKITCFRGSTKKVVSGYDPKCPRGYKIKK